MKLLEIAQKLDLECNVDINITGLNDLNNANENEISFLDNKRYIDDLINTKAAAVFIKEEFISFVPKHCIALISNEPYLTLAYASKLFAPKIVENEGNEASIGENTIILPNVYLGKNVIIGENCTLMAGVYVGDNVQIGSGTILNPNVVVYRDCIIGNSCIIHSGTTIGSDGYGFAHTKEGQHIKIYQNGNVVIANDVEIGSNSAIDRAVFGSTLIKDGVKIDNLVQIGHNCVIGEHSIIVSQVGVSGSTIFGRNVVMGGQSATSGHLEIAAFTTISARGGVTKSIQDGGKRWAGFPLMEHRSWLRLQGRIAKLLK